jgi:DNA replication protein DnaC
LGYGREICAAAENKLRERRRQAEENAEKRRQAFYRSCPRAQQIERTLCSTSVSAAKAVLGGKSAAQTLTALKEKNMSLQKELKDLMQAHGVSSLEPNYSCSVCRDTGYVDGKMCSCMKELLRTESYQRLNALTPLSLSTFESFSLNYYSDEPQEGRPSDRSIMRNTLQYCINYAHQFSLKSANVIMTGNTGLGKTHLSLAIANAAIQKGYGVVYSSVGSLVTKLENEHFGRDTETAALDSLQNCDLLILDDLGTEFRNSFSTSAIYGIINSRLLLEKPTIISTNLTTKEMADFYSERFASRIIGSYDRIAFVGRDIRQLKALAARGKHRQEQEG